MRGVFVMVDETPRLLVNAMSRFTAAKRSFQ
jgi:hypothetical protein